MVWNPLSIHRSHVLITTHIDCLLLYVHAIGQVVLVKYCDKQESITVFDSMDGLLRAFKDSTSLVVWRLIIPEGGHSASASATTSPDLATPGNKNHSAPAVTVGNAKSGSSAYSSTGVLSTSNAKQQVATVQGSVPGSKPAPAGGKPALKGRVKKA